MTDGALRLGILGAARISLGGIIPAAARTDAVEVAAVATRAARRLARSAKPHPRPNSSRTMPRFSKARRLTPSTYPCRTRCMWSGR